MPLPSVVRECCVTYYYPGKRSQFKVWSMVLTECISFLHHHKVEKSLSGTIISWGPSVLQYSFNSTLISHVVKYQLISLLSLVFVCATATALIQTFLIHNCNSQFLLSHSSFCNLPPVIFLKIPILLFYSLALKAPHCLLGRVKTPYPNFLTSWIIYSSNAGRCYLRP